MRVVAIDWSGAAAPSVQRRTIWTAEASDGQLVSLSAGRLREEAIRDLLARFDRGVEAAGLDFGFSFPAWWASRFGDVHGVWEAAGREGEAWLAGCEPPFWGRPGRPRPRAGRQWRRTETDIGAIGPQPKSVFQIGGAGAVGTGSVRGMPWLLELRRGGIAVWPFDALPPDAMPPDALPPDAPPDAMPTRPFVAEVWPRACTGAVVKSRAAARAAHLMARWPHATYRDVMIASEDAFDAGCTALTLSLGIDLPADVDAVDRIEGRILMPPLLIRPP